MYLNMSLSPIIGAASQVLNLFSKSSAKPDLSEASELFSNLKNLSQTDGAQFKQLTAQISSQLQSAAQTATSSGQSFLQTLSDQLNMASQTGSTAALHPHRHPIVSPAQSAYEQSVQTDITGLWGRLGS
jgi:hypothetical protein